MWEDVLVVMLRQVPWFVVGFFLGVVVGPRLRALMANCALRRRY